MKSLTWISDNIDNLKLHPISKVIVPLLEITLLLPHTQTPPPLAPTSGSLHIFENNKDKESVQTQNKDKENVQLGRPSPICKPAACYLAQEAICCYCNFCHYSFYCRPTFAGLRLLPLHSLPILPFSPILLPIADFLRDCQPEHGGCRRLGQWEGLLGGNRRSSGISCIVDCEQCGDQNINTKGKLFCILDVRSQSQSQSWSSFTNSSKWKHFGQISRSLPSLTILTIPDISDIYRNKKQAKVHGWLITSTLLNDNQW